MYNFQWLTYDVPFYSGKVIKSRVLAPLRRHERLLKSCMCCKNLCNNCWKMWAMSLASWYINPADTGREFPSSRQRAIPVTLIIEIAAGNRLLSRPPRDLYELARVSRYDGNRRQSLNRSLLSLSLSLCIYSSSFSVKLCRVLSASACIPSTYGVPLDEVWCPQSVPLNIQSLPRCTLDHSLSLFSTLGLPSLFGSFAYFVTFLPLSREKPPAPLNKRIW